MVSGDPSHPSNSLMASLSHGRTGLDRVAVSSRSSSLLPCCGGASIRNACRHPGRPHRQDSWRQHFDLTACRRCDQVMELKTLGPLCVGGHSGNNCAGSTKRRGKAGSLFLPPRLCTSRSRHLRASPKVVAAAMGHSVETHLAAYSRWCGDDVVADAFARAEQRLARGQRAHSSEI